MVWSELSKHELRLSFFGIKLANQCHKRYMKLKEYELTFFSCVCLSDSLCVVISFRGLWFWNVSMLQVDP
jgi:hypothetical protein